MNLIRKVRPTKLLYLCSKRNLVCNHKFFRFCYIMFKGKGDTTQLGGPIKIAKITGQVAQHGFIAFLSYNGLHSISFGFINFFQYQC